MGTCLLSQKNSALVRTMEKLAEANEIHQRDQALLLTSPRLLRRSSSSASEVRKEKEPFSWNRFIRHPVKHLEMWISSLGFASDNHSSQNIALLSSLCGIAIGAGLTGSALSETYSSCSIFLFILALGFFHLSEYILAAVFNPKGLSMSSFLFDNTGYKEAMLLSFSEFFLERYYFGSESFYFSARNRFLFSLGLMMVIIGQIFRISAIVQAGRNFSHQISVIKEDSHTLITTGIYRLMRHPSYCGYFLWSVGTQIMLVNPLSAVVFGYVCFNFFKDRIEYEERLLTDFFREDYVEYKAKVKFSGIPFVN